MSGDSDLIGIPVALGAIVAILAVFAAFFFVGAITGVVVLLVVVVLAGVLLVRLIRANEMLGGGRLEPRLCSGTTFTSRSLVKHFWE
jgi:hypothetical protein